MKTSSKPSVLIACCGNAINVKDDTKAALHQKEEFNVARRIMENLVDLYEEGYDKIIITHGNGPQVGKIFLQQELTSFEFPRAVSLEVCVADSQGRMGYILQHVFDNICFERGLKKKTSTVITQVVVDENDPAFKNPDKPIGVFYSEEDAKKLTEERGWVLKEDAGRGYRRVVPSPKPIEIIEKSAFVELLNLDFIAIGAGGGGIPVFRKDSGELRGVEAVIDKDRTSALLAYSIGIETLVILTNIDYAYINYNTPEQKPLIKCNVRELENHLSQGHFVSGSMRPKIEASIDFLKKGGKRAIIANLFDLKQAMKGEKGTQIFPD